ncbi:MAG: redox-sensing transcriptional repressor Rex [Treponema sp.]|nr:redox-sensing transcriptional repressor Rex [Treponema sp.]
MLKISESTRKRLVQLSQILNQTKAERVTSVKISELTGWSSAVIRKDICALGYKGGVSNGYNVRELQQAIVTSLGLSGSNGQGQNSGHKCCIVGLGKLGGALLENSIFFDTPFSIVAGFDANVNRVEILSASFPLYPASRMESVIPAGKIEFAILTVENQHAQALADRLVKCGIKGIVNYTNVVLSLPKEVAVENVSPVTALTNLLSKQ